MLAIADKRHRLQVAQAELARMSAELDLDEIRQQIALMPAAEQVTALRQLDGQQRTMTIAEIAQVSGERFRALVEYAYDSGADDLLADLERWYKDRVDLVLAELPERVRISVAYASPPQTVMLTETVLVADEPEIVYDERGAVVTSIPRTKPKTIHRRVARNRGPAIVKSQTVEVDGPRDPRLLHLAELHVTGVLASLAVIRNEYGVSHVTTPCLADGTIHRAAVIEAVCALLPAELRALVTTSPISERENRDAEGAERGRRAQTFYAYPVAVCARRARRPPPPKDAP